MIFHDHKAIFLHIGKTAGTAVEVMFCSKERHHNTADRDLMFGFDPEEGIFLQHATAETISRICGDEIFSKYYKFSVVRNPFVRTISVYHYLKKHHDKQFGSFENYVKGLPELISRPNIKKGSHHIAQIHFTHINGECICHNIAHFESLPHSLDTVKDILGVTAPLKEVNVRLNKPRDTQAVSAYYTQEMVEIMQDVYAADFTTFGYSNEPENHQY